jgi:polysaccharide biosynthesis/export protein
MRNFAVRIWAVWSVVALVGLTLPGLAQQPASPAKPQRAQAPAPATGMLELRPTYVLGPDDQILIRAANVEDINEKPFRIETDGFLTLPLLGRVQAGGLTVAQLEKALAERLAAFVRSPQVSISIVQYRAEPIFAVGAFQSPGIHLLQGRRTLIEMLTVIGGLQPNASRRIRLTRRSEFGQIPLPSAVEDKENQLSTVEINLGTLMENVSPAEDIELKPFDILRASTGGQVFATGQVNKAGAFELNDRESMGVIQLLSLAGGLAADAKPDKAVILRPILDTNRRAAIPINLKLVLSGRATDFPLMPNDILMIPKGSNALRTSMLVVIPVATALVTTLLVNH